MKKVVFIGLVSFIFCACSETPRVDTVAVRQEMQARKIAYVPKGDMSTEAEDLGLNLIYQFKSGTIKLDSIEKMEGISLMNYTEETISKASEVESQIFEAYKYSFEENGSLPMNNIQYDKKEGLYYISTPEINADSVFSMWSISISDRAVILNRSVE